MYEKKYGMTREENVFWAKRNLVDYIWKSANLEGIAVTFPETQTIYEGISVQGKSIGLHAFSCKKSVVLRWE